MIEKAILKVFMEGDIILIPCRDKANQQSIRSMSYQLRTRLIPPQYINSIGISNFANGENLYVKIYKREEVELFTINEKGEISVIKEKVDSEDARIAELMREEGKSEDEISNYLKGE